MFIVDALKVLLDSGTFLEQSIHLMVFWCSGWVGREATKIVAKRETNGIDERISKHKNMIDSEKSGELDERGLQVCRYLHIYIVIRGLQFEVCGVNEYAYCLHIRYYLKKYLSFNGSSTIHAIRKKWRSSREILRKIRKSEACSWIQ